MPNDLNENVLDDKTEGAFLHDLENDVVYTLRYVWHSSDGSVQCSVQTAVKLVHEEYCARLASSDDVSALFVEYLGEYNPRYFFRIQKIKSEEKKNETVCS